MRKIAILLIALMMVGVGLLSGCNEQIKKTSNLLKIKYFEVSPAYVAVNETANLTWKVTGATTVSIDKGIGEVNLTGHRIITPTKSTIYTLTAANGIYELTATTQVFIKSTIIPTITFIANDTQNTLTVIAIYPSYVLWSDILILGECNTSTLGTYIHVDDIITDCYGNVMIVYKPIYHVIANFSFSPSEYAYTTPNISCNTDATINKIIISSADTNTSWADITITNDTATARWAVYTGGGITNSSTNPTAVIITGDFILAWGASGNVKFTLRYKPINSLIGTWTIKI